VVGGTPTTMVQLRSLAVVSGVFTGHNGSDKEPKREALVRYLARAFSFNYL